MKIVYFHGFGSSGASGTVETLRNLLPDATIIAPDIPIDPVEALPFLKKLCEDEQPDIVVGTSMGGMYAQQMRGFVRICVNPALNMSTMSSVLKTGEHKFFNRRKDNQKTFREAFAQTAQGETCSLETVDNSINLMIKEADHLYSEKLSRLSLPQKELLYAIANEGRAQKITSGAFIRKHQLSSTSSVQQAIKKLLALGLVSTSSSE